MQKPRLRVDILKGQATRAVPVDHQYILGAGGQQTRHCSVDLGGGQAPGLLVVATVSARLVGQRSDAGHALYICAHQHVHGCTSSR